MIFEISTTDEPGTFEVSAKFMGVTMEKVELVFQVYNQPYKQDISYLLFIFHNTINLLLLGSAANAIRRRFDNENVRQSKDQRQLVNILTK